MNSSNDIFAHRRGHRWGARVLTALVAVLALGACDGENLFTGSGKRLNSGPPVIVDVTVPEVVGQGGRIDVAVRAVAPRGMRRVDVRFRRGVVLERSIEFANETDTVTANTTADVPLSTVDSVVVVEVVATDRDGRSTEPVSRTVRITRSEAPIVTVATASPNASPGSNVELRVTANDLVGLQSVGYAVLNERGDTILRNTVATAGASRDTIFVLALPSTLPAGSLRIVGFAVNSASLLGESSPVSLILRDDRPPRVDILEPQSGESYTRGTPLRVRVHIQDTTSGIAEVRLRGVAFRFFPDTLQNSPEVVRFPEITVPFPQGPQRPATIDTIIVRDLIPNADTTTEPIFIIATARDFSGNVGVDTVRVIPGPRITILNPTNGAIARVGSEMQLRVQAFDPAAGLDSLKIYISGVRTDTIVRRNLAGTVEPVEITPLISTGNVAGTLELRAEVWNSLGTRGGTPQPVRVTVSQELSSDAVPPRVLRLVETADRIELGDSIKIHVRGTDDAGSGIVRMGAVVFVIPANEGPGLPRDTFFFSTPTFTAPRTGTPDTTFIVRLKDSYLETGVIRFPQAFTLQVHAYAIDANGNCGASVQESYQSLPCQTVNATARIAAGQTGQVRSVLGVVGTSVRLPTGSLIADALPDTTNLRIYMSNFARNQIEVLSLTDTLLRAPVLVGSQPWGMFLVPGRGAVDTLMVANSGGTNISFVPTNTMREDAPRRLLTPNEVLWEVVSDFVDGRRKFFPRKLEFSDRPQFVAQDSNKVILYSTKPAPIANTEGTIRFAIADPTPDDPTDQVRPESRFIYGREAVIPLERTFAFAHVDSIYVVTDPVTLDEQVIVFDHVPGRPELTFHSGPQYVEVADSALKVAAALRGTTTDVFYSPGGWNRAAVGFRDTTYVAYSKDLSTIAFGEGGAVPFGRVVLWSARTRSSGVVSSAGTFDLINNAAEVVTGIGLNINGNFGAVRGRDMTYFFSNDVKLEGQLRLQGVFSQGVAGGNGGVALHPHHGTILNGTNSTTMAFIATGSRTVKIVDTFHYFERGEVPIRDAIVGQLRSVPPIPSMNFGLTSDMCDYAIAQLVGVTTTNHIVIVTVRNRDVQKNIPVAERCRQ